MCDCVSMKNQTLYIDRFSSVSSLVVTSEKPERENQRISMRTDLEILSCFDLIITISTSDSECASEAEEQMSLRETDTRRERENQRNRPTERGIAPSLSPQVGGRIVLAHEVA